MKFNEDGKSFYIKREEILRADQLCPSPNFYKIYLDKQSFEMSYEWDKSEYESSGSIDITIPYAHISSLSLMCTKDMIGLAIFYSNKSIILDCTPTSILFALYMALKEKMNPGIYKSKEPFS